MGIKVPLTLSHSIGFRCCVCRQPKHLNPQERLREDTVNTCFQELRDGVMPVVCLDCGGTYEFAKDRKALRRYLQFLANDAYNGAMRKELEDMAHASGKELEAIVRASGR